MAGYERRVAQEIKASISQSRQLILTLNQKWDHANFGAGRLLLTRTTFDFYSFFLMKLIFIVHWQKEIQI
jgi:hypothetical protein